MVTDCPETVTHKVHLLDAEILAFEGRYDDALCRYELSIEYAAKNGHYNCVSYLLEEGIQIDTVNENEDNAFV